MTLKLETKPGKGKIGIKDLYEKILKKDFIGIASNQQNYLKLRSMHDFLLSFDIENVSLDDFNKFFTNQNNFVIALDQLEPYLLDPNLSNDPNSELFLRIKRHKDQDLLDILFFMMNVSGYKFHMSLTDFRDYLSKLGKNIHFYDYKNLQGFQFKDSVIPVNDLHIFAEFLGKYEKNIKFAWKNELLALRLRHKIYVFYDGTNLLTTKITDGSNVRELVLVCNNSKVPYFLGNTRYKKYKQVDYFETLPGKEFFHGNYEKKPIEDFIRIIIPYMYKKVA